MEEGSDPGTTNQVLINAAFPLTHLEWYYNTAEGKGNFLAYCQALLVSFKAMVYDVRQESDKSPAAFLEQLQEAFRRYSPFDLESQEVW